MIKTFRHKGLQGFFETGSKAGIQPDHAAKLKRQLVRLDLSKNPGDMNVPGWKLHQLSTGHWSIWGSYRGRVSKFQIFYNSPPRAGCCFSPTRRPPLPPQKPAQPCQPPNS